METKMTKKELIYSIEVDKNGTKTASINIDVLMTEADYSAWWHGENGDSGYYTENMENISELFNRYVLDGKFLDMQIWEEGNAYVHNIDPSKLEEILKEVEKFDNYPYELVKNLKL